MTAEPHRPPLRLTLVIIILAVNLAVTLLFAAGGAVPAWLAPYLAPNQAFAVLGWLNFGLAVLVLPLFFLDRPLRLRAWQDALYQGALLILLALPFLALSTRLQYTAAGALPRLLVGLFVISACSILVARLTGRYYYPTAIAVCAAPPLLAYLHLDVTAADGALLGLARQLTAVSPPGIVYSAMTGRPPLGQGASAVAGLFLYVLLLTALVLLPPRLYGGTSASAPKAPEPERVT
jgi:hypothetical protein